MSTQWRWLAISPEINLTLVLDSDDPELIERVESSAKASGISLVRVEPFDAKPLPADYWETAE